MEGFVVSLSQYNREKDRPGITSLYHKMKRENRGINNALLWQMVYKKYDEDILNSVKTDVKLYLDPDSEHNSAKHHTGKNCINLGCAEKAGTAWSPYWCWKHNAERLERITANLEKLNG